MRGSAFFAVDSTAGATWMGSHAPLLDISKEQLVEFETAVRPVPQFDPANPSMISQGPSVCVFNKEDPQEVLASWLFTQYLLSNDVQIAYSCTEGYVPVTTKAQQDPAYQDYLSREGEDEEEHYSVKIQAVKLLLSHLDDTFVTPVFNGSASVRSAAGQMIEEVAKSTKRKQTVDDAYMEELFTEVTALYRLDQITGAEGKKDLGPLPGQSAILLAVLALCWLGIGGYTAAEYGRKRKNGKQSH